MQSLSIDGDNLGGTGATGAVEATQAGYGPAVEVAVSTNGGVEWSTPTAGGDSEATTAVNEESDNGVGYDKVVFEYHPPFLLGSLDPPTGPAIGGTLVSISLATFDSDDGAISADGDTTSGAQWQFSFDATRDALANCRFNGTVVPATVVSNTSVECVAPPTVPSGGVTFVAVSVNGLEVFGASAIDDGADSSSVVGSFLEFFYLPDEAEMSLFPPSGPVKGGTLVEVSSRHIADAASALLLHQNSEGSFDGFEISSVLSNESLPLRLPPSSVICSFNSNDGGAETSAVLVAASGISFHWDGTVNADGRETGVGRVLCLSPPALDNLPEPVTVQVSLNGGSDFTNQGAQFYYRPEAHVFGVEPAYGPVSGGNSVRVEGTAFRGEGGPGGRSEEMVLCRFGDQEVGATVHAAGLVSCRAPPMPAVPEEQEIEVQCGPAC